MFAKFPRKSFSADTSVSRKNHVLQHDAVAKIGNKNETTKEMQKNLRYLRYLREKQDSISMQKYN